MPSHPQLLSEPIELFFAIDTLWFECQREGPRDGEEAHEALFGEGALITKLKAANLAREIITKTIRGPVRTIADFAVTSGHEALTVFAGRLASFTRIRRRHIPEAKAELKQEISGRTWKGTRPLGLNDLKLHDAQVAFAKCVTSALRGWWEHRAWIHRSIVEELDATDSSALRVRDRSSIPRLTRESLPWLVLTALSEAGGELKRATLLDRVSDHFPNDQHKSKRKQVSTMIGPSGQLVATGLVSVAGQVVTILPPGAEALRD
jgi:hypothetical protein